MSSLEVVIPEPAERWLEERVAKGGFRSASDYISDLILRDRAASEDGARRLANLDTSFDRGIAELDAGGGHDADEVFDALDAKYTAMMANAPF